MSEFHAYCPAQALGPIVQAGPHSDPPPLHWHGMRGGSPVSSVCAMQVRAGTGGDEAALWAADLVRMFTRYATEQGWKVQPVNTNAGESGGIKEAVIQVQPAHHSLGSDTGRPV